MVAGKGSGRWGRSPGSIGKTGMLFPAEPRRRLTSSFIERGNLDCGGDLGQTLRMPGGKLWSISVLVPSCPSQSLSRLRVLWEEARGTRSGRPATQSCRTWHATRTRYVKPKATTKTQYLTEVSGETERSQR